MWRIFTIVAARNMADPYAVHIRVYRNLCVLGGTCIKTVICGGLQISLHEFDRRYSMTDLGRVILIHEHEPPYWCNRRLGPINIRRLQQFQANNTAER